MDTIQFFLSAILKLIIIIFVGIFIFIVLQKFFPNFLSKFSFYRSSGAFFTDNWLPDPVNFQDVAKGRKADLSGNVYEGGLTPGTSYVIYSDSGMKIIKVPPTKSQVFNAQTAGFSDSSLYVRNLSIYNGDSVNTHKTIYGEARSTFFANGTFPIYIIDTQGRVFAVETAIATEQWSIPGWSRFSVQIRSLLPSHQPCQLLFIPNPQSPDANTGGRALIPVSCN